MKKVIIGLLVFVSAFSTFAQNNVIVLHPAIGDTIDLVEKQTYLLFPEIKDVAFTNAQILKESDKYFLILDSRPDKEMIEVKLSNLEEYYTNIEKLLAYYSYLENPDKLKVAPLVILNEKDTCALEMDIEYLNPKMKKKLKKDSYRYQDLKSEAVRNGYWGDDQENYIKTGSHFIIFMSDKRKK